MNTVLLMFENTPADIL